jgi:hypothetical protein
MEEYMKRLDAAAKQKQREEEEEEEERRRRAAQPLLKETAFDRRKVGRGICAVMVSEEVALWLGKLLAVASISASPFQLAT